MNPIAEFTGSISKIASYEHFLGHPYSKVFLYLLLITLVFSGIGSTVTAIEVSTDIDEMITRFATDVPDFELSNGRLWMDEEQPFIFAESAESFYVADTSGELDESILNDYEVGIFISEYGYTQKTVFDTRYYDFSVLDGITVTKGDVENWLPLLKWLNLFIIVFGLIFFFLGKLFSAFIVSVLGLFLEVMANYKIGFGNLYKLSIYALTLSVVLQFLIRLTSVYVPNFWIIYYGLPLVYLWKTLEYLRSKKMPDNDNTGSPTYD